MATGKGIGVARGQITTATTTTLIPAPDATMGGTKIYILSLRFLVKTAWTTGRLIAVDGTTEAAGFNVSRFAMNTADTEYTLYGYVADADELPGLPLTAGNAFSAITTGTPGVTDYEVVYIVR